VVLSEEVEVFGFDSGNRPYRRPGQTVALVTVQHPTNSNANKGGILGFFSKMFSGSSSGSSSSGYRQPQTSSPGDVGVICQPVEGIACQPMEAIACQPVEGVACQPVMLQGP
jgi:hypothetical protein